MSLQRRLEQKYKGNPLYLSIRLEHKQNRKNHLPLSVQNLLKRLDTSLLDKKSEMFYSEPAPVYPVEMVHKTDDLVDKPDYNNDSMEKRATTNNKTGPFVELFHKANAPILESGSTGVENSDLPKARQGNRSRPAKNISNDFVEINKSGNPLLDRVERLEKSGIVRLHRNTDAHRFAEEMGAKAFAIGRDIYMGRKYSDLGDRESQAVLAHELKHVEQYYDQEKQTEMTDPEGRANLEREAHVAEDTVRAGGKNSLNGVFGKENVKSNPSVSSLYDSFSGFDHLTATVSENIENNSTENFSASNVSTGFDNIDNAVNRGDSRGGEMSYALPAISAWGGDLPSANSLIPSYSGDSAPVMAAMEDEAGSGEEEAVQNFSMASLKKKGFAALLRKAKKRETSMQPSLDMVVDEIYQRIQERLIIERERFVK